MRSSWSYLTFTELFQLDTNTSYQTGAQTLNTIKSFESSAEALQLYKLCVMPDEVMIPNAHHIEYSCPIWKV